MELLVTLALIVLVGVYIAWPIVTASPRPRASKYIQESPLDALLREKEATLAAIKELEFDYQTGKLSAEDYQDLRARYEAKAVTILRALDAGGKGVSLEDAVEEEIQAFRRRQREATCEGCGETLPSGARFCPHCGRAVAKG
ncbi:MAG: zinc ribbon domain-containing protein [Armatimonadota bacterium]|nr:zinc ribbon domain-containing protein [Armatimonadota bacterium]MDR5704354.1 zinc ribbon domain-containing protein [Armatimonadota bacterium]MDR7434897.1 zinc ribbon domain-containing protein [Armatimonadota bacterium]